MNCSGCRNTIAGKEDSLRCTLKSCNQVYHMFCSGVMNMTNDVKKSWICPECRCAAKIGGDNSLTPVGLSKMIRDPNVTFRKKPIKEVQSSCGEPDELTVEIRNLRSEIYILRDQLVNAVTLISSYEAKLENYAAQVVALSTKLEDYQIKAPQTLSSAHSPSIASNKQERQHGTQKSDHKNKARLEKSPNDLLDVVNITTEGRNDSRTEYPYLEMNNCGQKLGRERAVGLPQCAAQPDRQ
ncbi:unnamed protein product [Euphydryas editha]|uniref:PHD-type domain-containing protein n=1 Tax=Euphydryas editha TaxID=104508 RepID=A0AAU9UGK8_EUPED|nr:unnamed protein product [Euphydryas editha]